MTAAEQFRQAIERAGLTPPETILPDGKLHRFASNGDREDDAGWYVCFNDGIPAGAFGDWRSGISQKWSGKHDQQMTPQERADYAKKIEAARQQRETDEKRRHADGAQRARAIWEASPPAPPNHPYLHLKQVKPHGLRIATDGRLLVPIYVNEALSSLEYIDSDGDKKFLPGGAKKAGYFWIGDPSQLTGPILLGEGFATMASVHEATGQFCVIAFDAVNLRAVAEALRTEQPDATIIVCGDHDKNGVGQAKAREAAEAVHGVVLIPDTEGMDWNDVAVQEGTEAVRCAIARALNTNVTDVSVIDEGEEVDDLVDDDLGDFPEAAWRGSFATYRAAMEGTSEASDAAHFAALWAVAGACLRRRLSFYYAFPQFANVYLIYYGNTGDSKTSAARQGLKLLPDSGIKLLRGVGSAEALGDWMQQPEDGEALSHLLFIEELGTLLARGGWEGSTLLSFLTETFDAPDRYEIPFRKNPVLVQEPTPTLIAGTTIEWLWKGLREIDVHGGFGNRLFYLTGTPKPPIPLPRKPNMEALYKTKAAIHRLLTLPQMELFFTSDAQALWSDFYTEWKGTSWSELTTAATKRVPAYIIKLAMVYACFERASLITQEQLSAAIQVGFYGAKCADRLMNRHRQHGLQGKCETRVLEVLSKGEFPTWKIHRMISGKYTADALAKAIKALVATGAIVPKGKTKRNEPIYGTRTRREV